VFELADDVGDVGAGDAEGIGEGGLGDEAGGMESADGPDVEGGEALGSVGAALEGTVAGVAEVGAEEEVGGVDAGGGIAVVADDGAGWEGAVEGGEHGAMGVGVAARGAWETPVASGVTLAGPEPAAGGGFGLVVGLEVRGSDRTGLSDSSHAPTRAA
jgi:hypothetical protein